MREYKFRGKDTGEWVYGQVAYDKDDTYIIQKVEQDGSYGEEETMLYATMWYMVDKATVGQYTGQKDENKKEIYAGDIVKGEYYNVLVNASRNIKGEVEFRDGVYMTFDTISVLLNEILNIEVIRKYNR